MRSAVKFVSMMKLTTPETASAPYTDEAPPVRTSTRLISDDGMKLMSATEPWRGSPGCRRRPLTSTRVRCDPRPRRFTDAVPVEPFDTFEPCAANDCGSELIRSSVRVVPWSFTSWLDSTVTGLAEVRFGCGMRVPVMTMSCEDLTVEPCALVEGTAVWPSTGVVVSGAVGVPLLSDGFGIWAGGGVV